MIDYRKLRDLLLDWPSTRFGDSSSDDPVIGSLVREVLEDFAGLQLAVDGDHQNHVGGTAKQRALDWVSNKLVSGDLH